MCYIFSITDNSSIIINVDYIIKRSCRASKRPKSIIQGWLLVIFCLFSTKSNVIVPVPFKVQSGFACTS